MTQPRLERELPDGSRQVVELTVPDLRVGRRADSDLQIVHKSVSREHAALIVVGDGYDIVDLESVYGTFVNDQSVSWHRLKDGDRIRLARHTPEFRYSAPSQRFR